MGLFRALKQFRNGCRPKPLLFSWFSPKENHTSRSFSDHSDYETGLIVAPQGIMLLLVASPLLLSGCVPPDGSTPGATKSPQATAPTLKPSTPPAAANSPAAPVTAAASA